MTILARSSVGRILLHLLAMLGDRSVRFHFEGIVRELPWIVSGLAMIARVRNRLIAALALYLTEPIKNPNVDPESLAAALNRGDLALGNSRFAAIISRSRQGANSGRSP